uniref:Uncharacterized protein n=1 Tax=Haptolina ericina TaxID=156174 RepID=A0A7S3AYH9_9EUKA
MVQGWTWADLVDREMRLFVAQVPQEWKFLACLLSAIAISVVLIAIKNHMARLGGKVAKRRLRAVGSVLKSVFRTTTGNRVLRKTAFASATKRHQMEAGSQQQGVAADAAER